MPGNKITLRDVRKAGITKLELACDKCDRKGRYQVSGLVKKYGAEMGLPELKHIVAADCPRQNAVSIYERCGVMYPSLPSIKPS